MRRLILFAILLLPVYPAAAGVFQKAPENGAPDKYIVLLKKGVARKASDPGRELPTVAQVAQSLGSAHGGRVTEVWEHALQAFIVRMPEKQARRLANDPRVAAVEQDYEIRVSSSLGDCYTGTPTADTRTAQVSSPQAIDCADPDPANVSSGTPLCRDNWGIDRIELAGRNQSYTFTNTGSSVNVYVVDYGIYRQHVQFQGRVQPGFDATYDPDLTPNPPPPPYDEVAHGTHVAAIAGGGRYGVAKNVLIHPVRTDRQPGRLATSLWLSALDRAFNWIAADVSSKRSAANPYPAVVNWSGGNTANLQNRMTLQEAIRGVINQGVPVVQSAGNEQPTFDTATGAPIDACDLSFGSTVPEVIVVGGTDHHDRRWANPAGCTTGHCGSVVGSCIDIWAPAADINSATYGSANGTNNNLACRLSGTSMAAPHVTGVIALYLQSNPTASVADVERALRSRGMWGVLEDNPADPRFIGAESDNVLVNADTLSIGADLAPVASFTVSCPGLQCTFNASGSSADSVQYTWLIGTTTLSGQTVRHNFSSTGNYKVTLRVADSGNKTDHLAKTAGVTVNDAPPTGDFTSSCNGLTCTFEASPSNDTVSVAWKFGDGNTGSGNSVQHTYASANTYSVESTFTDNLQQTGSRTRSVTVTSGNVPAATILSATADAGTVTIRWTPATGADGYDIERNTGGGWVIAKYVSGGSSSSTTDVPTSPSGIVLYQVISRIGTTRSTAATNRDVAFVGTFADDALVKAEHITDLRRAVNTLRAMGSLGAIYSPEDLNANLLRTTLIDDSHFLTLMQNLLNTRSALNITAAHGWRASPPPPPGQSPNIVEKEHIEDLRLGFH